MNYEFFCTFAVKSTDIVTKEKTKYKQTKFYLAFALVVAALAGIAHLWKLSPVEEQMLAKQQQRIEKDSVAAPAVIPEKTEIPESPENSDNSEYSEYSDYSEYSENSDFSENSDTLSADSASSTFFSRKVWSYPECFNDSNATQLVAAEANGIQPAETREEIKQLVSKGLLTNISTSPYYIIEDLTHSMPYLVPKAQLLLNTIGINFVDSLQSKGYPLHIPVITSVLRTASDIQNLQRGNINSVTNSCHCYGTTIDITYNRFVPLEGTELTRYDDNLKKVLAEVLYDLRAEDRCYVKYEKLQACFHLTVR